MNRSTFCGLRHGCVCVLLVFFRLTARVTFFALYFTVPQLFKAFRELKLPPKQGEIWKEGDKPGERREKHWHSKPLLDSPSLRRRFGETRDAHERLLTDVLRCCCFTPAKQNTMMLLSQQHITMLLHLCLCLWHNLLSLCYFCALFADFVKHLYTLVYTHTYPFI